VLGIAPVTRATGVDLLERRAGSVTLELLSISYVPSAQITSIAGTYLGRTFTVTTPQAGTSRYVVQFPNVPPGTSGLGIAGYTSPAAGEVPAITAMAVTGGTAFTAMQATPLRIDNAAPNPPALFTLAGATTSSGTPWVPTTYTFDRPQVFVSGGDAADGVGGTTVEFYGQRTTQAGLGGGSATGADCAAGTLVKAATAGELRALRPVGAVATANEFRVRAVEWDRLGNVRCTELGTTFGVVEP
jgi:hypothetical protein